MNLASRITLTLHRITGTIIAVFFLMWWFTGLVLLYHGFPRLSESDYNSHLETLPPSTVLPDSVPEGLRGLTIRQFMGQTLTEFNGKDTSYTLTSTGGPVLPVNFSTAKKVASEWVKAPVSKVDTLYKRDQWILYSRYENELPIYKFYFDDPQGSQLYIASRSAQVQQLTERKQRIWAWAGAIPHKLYLPGIRSDVDRWKLWITIGASFCLIASISGVVIALIMWMHTRKVSGRWQNPFKKRLYRWHFTFGLIFAIPLIAWSISGIFSMQRVPRWLVPMEGSYFAEYGKIWGRGLLPADEYKLGFKALNKHYPQIKSVSYGRIGTIPTYEIVSGDSTVTVNASDTVPHPLDIPQEVALAGLRNLYGDSVSIELTELDGYDEYYYSISERSPLPVYKAVIGDADGTIYYIDPRDGHLTFLNRNKIWRKYLFSGIHYLNLHCFTGHELIWKLCMWAICLCGMFYCLISCILGVRYLIRLCRRR